MGECPVDPMRMRVDSIMKLDQKSKVEGEGRGAGKGADKGSGKGAGKGAGNSAGTDARSASDRGATELSDAGGARGDSRIGGVNGCVGDSEKE